MTLIRRAILALALIASAAPALAQPPPVPALPDTERRTSYNLTNSGCGCTVQFPLYGVGTDVDAWLEVWINGVRKVSTDPSFGWAITSPTGPIATIPRPITDAVLTFGATQTGTIQIVGAERPRRINQFSENQGVPARALNQAFTDIVVQNRETWDKINDVTGRALVGLPGEFIVPMPSATARAGKYLGFDATGLVPVVTSAVPGTGVGGPVSSVVGDVALFNNTSGTLLKDAGVGVSTVIPNAFTGPFPQTANGTAMGHVLGPLDSNVIYSGNGIIPFQVESSNPYVIGVGGTVASSSLGQTFILQFTSAGLAGSPISTPPVVAIGGDTISTIADKLCAAVQAIPALYNANTGLPVFCQGITQSRAGGFNLQWDVLLTDLVVASTGTGSITLPAPTRTLDYSVSIFGRYVPGHVGVNGDNSHCLQIMGQSNSAFMDAVVAAMCGTLDNAQGGSITSTLSFSTSYLSAGHGQLGMRNGVVIYDVGDVLPTGGFLGQGTLNVGQKVVLSGGCGLQLTVIVACGGLMIGNTTTNGSLILQSTQNGAPSGDFVQITAGNKAGYRFDGTTTTLGSAGNIVSKLAFVNLTSGTITLQPPTGALGTITLTLPASSGSLSVLPADATTGNILQSPSTAPTWSTATFPSTVAAAGQMLNSSAANIWGATATPTLGASGTLGSVTFGNATSGLLTLQPVTGAMGTATVLIPATNDTLVARASTDTLTGKTYDTAGSGNVFKINGTTINAITGTGSTAVVSAGPTLTGVTTVGSLVSGGAITGADNLVITKAAGTLSESLTASASQVQVSYTGGSGGVAYLFTDNAAGLNQKNMQMIVAAGSMTFRDLTDIFGVQHTFFTLNQSNGVTNFPGAIASTSSITGTVTVTGGLGVSGDIWAGGNHAVSTAAKTLLLKQGANGAVGTFVCTSGGSITVSNTNVAINDAIIISLNAAGGTISNAPALNAITAATSFVAKCATSDTSTYNYAIIKNAA